MLQCRGVANFFISDCRNICVRACGVYLCACACACACACVCVICLRCTQVIAKRLLESKTTVPHYYLSMDVCADDLLKLRETLNAQAKKDKEGKVRALRSSVRARVCAQLGNNKSRRQILLLSIRRCICRCSCRCNGEEMRRMRCGVVVKWEAKYRDRCKDEMCCSLPQRA